MRLEGRRRNDEAVDEREETRDKARKWLEDVMGVAAGVDGATVKHSWELRRAREKKRAWGEEKQVKEAEGKVEQEEKGATGCAEVWSAVTGSADLVNEAQSGLENVGLPANGDEQVKLAAEQIADEETETGVRDEAEGGSHEREAEGVAEDQTNHREGKPTQQFR
ncbi:hypothetical protein BDY21DRAFT_348824 [Lineolata rhizophorae]|uniref:Uncharacterized protein n=1 Tax=Lineolata rhizophorae TaxID=578093 RepID=A0A6A6NWF4_9PEZI|nr:hypothetical protein BDY21DRAFT_348824 [Lineolata rhizophorae]